MISCRFLPLVLGLAGLASSVQGAVYSSDFNSLNPGVDVPGQEGWGINDATLHLSTVEALNATQGVAIGGLYAPPALGSVELTHPYGLSLSGSSFDVDFAVFPSDQAPGRDTFGWSFRDGANLLMSVVLRPNPAISTQLEVLWQGPTGAPVSTNFDIIESGLYHLSLDFGSSGANGTFNGQISALVGAPLIWNGTLTGLAAATIGTFGADFDAAALPADAGDNFMLFDNLAMVPEPGSALLIALGLLAAVRRRRTV